MRFPEDEIKVRRRRIRLTPSLTPEQKALRKKVSTSKVYRETVNWIKSERDGSAKRRKDEEEYFGEITNADVKVIGCKIDEEHYRGYPMKAEFMIRVTLLGFFKNKNAMPEICGDKWIVGDHLNGSKKDILNMISEKMTKFLYSKACKLNKE